MKVCLICERSYDDATAFCSEETHSPLVEKDNRTIEGYQLQRRLKAKSGELYRARQIASGTSCLIRIVKADERQTEDFLRQAKIASALYHPNIASVYEAGVLETGEVYLVTEDLDGRTLRGVLDNAKTPDLLTSMDIVRQTAEALQALHMCGLTHGGVNPRNLVLARDGEGVTVRLRNIDLAGVVSNSIVSDKFSMDSHLDSLRYFALEQCLGEPTTFHSDVYSLGVVFYELLAGAPPFLATKAAGLIEQLRSQTPPPIKIDSFELRMLVTHAVMQALHKTPRLRQATADLFARQLRHIEQLATHSSTPPPVSRERIRKPQPPNVAPELLKPMPVTSKKPRFIDTVGVSIEDWEGGKEPLAPVEIPAQIAATAVIENVPDVVAVSSAARSEEIENVLPPASPSREIDHGSRLNSWKKKFHRITTELKSKLAEMPSLAELHVATSRPAEITSLALSSLAEPETSAKRQPRKIEWEQPEDIPSTTEVIAVLGHEGVSNLPVVEVRTEEKHEQPSVVAIDEAIETVAVSKEQTLGPEFEVPTIVVESKEQTSQPKIEPPAIVRRKKRASKRLKKRSRPIVVEELPKPVVPIPEVAPAIAQASTATTPAAPKIKKDRLLTDIKPISPAVMAAIRAAAKAGTVQTPIVVQPDPDEITLVRARREPSRVRIDIDQVIRRRPSSQIGIVEFTPTILGGGKHGAEVREPSNHASVFAHYYGAITGSSAIRSRSVMFGIGAIGLIAMFLLGAVAISNYFQATTTTEATEARVTTTTSSSAAAPPVVGQVVVPTKIKATSTEIKPTSAEIKPPREEDTKKSATKTVTADREPAKTDVSSKKTSPPAAREKTSAKIKTESPRTQKAGTDSKPKISGATRPRIVKLSTQ